jgi:nicotinamide-nucleotide amidase
MFVELITTGSELLLGSTLNTHQQWIGQQLAAIGLPVSRQVTVPDTGSAIADAVEEAVARADLIITTGGLGPTADDRTRDEIARLLDLELQTDSGVLTQIEKIFRERGRPLPPNFDALAHVQAQVPSGATVLVNHHGSAPGLAMDIPSAKFGSRDQANLLIMLPGPPRELQPMFCDAVIPLIKRHFPDATGFLCKTFHTLGVGESRVEEALAQPLRSLMQRGLEVGFCARSGEVDIRLSAVGEPAAELIEEASQTVMRLLQKHVYSDDGSSLHEVIIHELRRQRRTVVTAESCTGGFVSNLLTNVPGASDVFLGGLVTYSNRLKQALLGVREETLEQHGAVSEATAREMAAGARDRYSANYAISITGIAGPTGGTQEKPVGTVFMGLAHTEGVEVARQINVF